ncbi:DUF3737 family protein [Campylobacter sp. faydin G-140]|uniref:DUF3737 family protein n=1 Tax=Campylobacter anatolicus TaxID=2829105 RepID=UPI001B9DE11B|nr:DUF3737 family protein [Campylobacter anatolicus]MBR8465149.1 DUF3737 family protein [Campylobacter anatolicus]
MKEIVRKSLVGERAMFEASDLRIVECTFEDGESPLKHSKNLQIFQSLFKWKYPCWYSQNLSFESCMFLEMARAGIWYANGVIMKNCTIESPKIFRQTSGLDLQNVTIFKADETMWNCRDIKMKNIVAKGDYFAMGSADIDIDGFELLGNYSFDGSKNVHVKNAKILSKDAFWNSENVIIEDSFISGEYIGWNSKNLTFINCMIESLQGFCYIKNLTLKNCKLINTTRAFEYSSDINAQIIGRVDSIVNPISGVIVADEIGEITLDDSKIDPKETKISTSK